MASYTQGDRPLRIQTPLGDDALLLTGFRGRERLSGLFQFECELLSERDFIPAAELVGQTATLTIHRADHEPRHFHGVVSRLALAGRTDRLSIYRATLVPWLWLLTRTSDCRIFQNRTVPEIVEQVLSECPRKDFAWSLRGTHARREYCVQYRETDFDFISRLLEEEGIYYYFEHAQDGHKMVIADAPSAYRRCEETGIGIASSTGSTEWTDQIKSWEHGFEFRPGKWAHTDYNFKTPSARLLSQTTSRVELPGIGAYEVFDYPGEYEQRGQGEQLARIRMEEEEAQFETITGTSICRTFSPGYTFTVERHHTPAEEGQTHVLTAVEHRASLGGAYTSGDGGGSGELDYENAFSCIPAGVAFRPPRTTPRPTVKGVQTAIVVGPQGQEIYTDEHARVKVQFHWDRYGKRNENSSCWIRVSQPWAGGGYGGVAVPRIGAEVVIEFIEGDPDRPLVIGRLYNAETMPYGSQGGKPELDRLESKRKEVAAQTKQVIAPPPRLTPGAGADPGAWAIPILTAVAGAIAGAAAASGLSKLGKAFEKAIANPAVGAVESAMMTTIKSNSLGGSGGSNEITLNDTGGAETLFIKAQKDMIVSVNNNHSTLVDNDQITEVSGDRHTIINGKDTLNVAKESETTVGKRYSLTVKKSAVVKIQGLEQHSVDKNYELTVMRDMVTTVKKNATTTITGNEKTGIDKDSTLVVKGKRDTTIHKEDTTTIKGDQKTTLEKNQDVTVKGDEKIKIEKTAAIEVTDKITVDGKKTIECTAADELVLKCGPCSITLKKSGEIEIKATNIKIAATANVENQGAMISSKASAVHKIEGTPVMINC